MLLYGKDSLMCRVDLLRKILRIRIYWIKSGLN